MTAKNMYSGRTALCEAVANSVESCRDIVVALLAHGADPNAVDEEDRSPVSHAVSCGDGRVLDELLRAGGKLLLGQSDSISLHDASSATAVNTLAEAGADPNARDVWDDPALVHYINDMDSDAQVDVVRTLLQRGCDPKATGSEGNTPLHAVFSAASERIRTSRTTREGRPLIWQQNQTTLIAP